MKHETSNKPTDQLSQRYRRIISCSSRKGDIGKSHAALVVDDDVIDSESDDADGNDAEQSSAVSKTRQDFSQACEIKGPPARCTRRPWST